MQKILILLILFSFGCGYQQTAPISIPSVDIPQIKLHGHPLYPKISYENNKFILDTSDYVSYVIDSPLVVYNIPESNGQKLHDYVDGYNSAADIVYDLYKDQVQNMLFILNKQYKMLSIEQLNKILYQENKKLFESEIYFEYKLNMQRCQYGFITKTLTIIPNRYYKDKFIYELQSTTWFIGNT